MARDYGDGALEDKTGALDRDREVGSFHVTFLRVMDV